MNVLIVKLGATGDVVRTTPLLRRFTGTVTWITAAKNLPLLENLREGLRCFSWEQRERAAVGFFEGDGAVGYGDRSSINYLQDLLCGEVSEDVDTFDGATPAMVGAMTVCAGSPSNSVAFLLREDDEGEWAGSAVDGGEIGDAMGFQCCEDTGIFFEDLPHR